MLVSAEQEMRFHLKHTRILDCPSDIETVLDRQVAEAREIQRKALASKAVGISEGVPEAGSCRYCRNSFVFVRRKQKTFFFQFDLDYFVQKIQKQGLNVSAWIVLDSPKVLGSRRTL